MLDAAALRHNLQTARKLAAHSKILAVVKADAYGHSIGWAVDQIGDLADGFAVATLAEGVACRGAVARKPIVVLSGLQTPQCLKLCQRFALQPVAHTFAQIEWLEKLRGAPITIWLKIETGMHRLGLTPAEFHQAMKILPNNRCIKQIHLMSHFACADHSGGDHPDSASAMQLNNFRAATDAFADSNHNCARSLANSAALMRIPAAHFQWVRPGIMLYGGSPLLNITAAQLKLKPVMHLQARVVAVKEIAAGQAVGYGGDYVAARAMRIGLVGCGYGDGYPRGMDAKAEVGIRGRRAPIVGRISMDLLTVDITDFAEVAAGDEVTLWGDSPTVDEVAAWANTIPNELLCRVSQRVPRLALN